MPVTTTSGARAAHHVHHGHAFHLGYRHLPLIACQLVYAANCATLTLAAERDSVLRSTDLHINLPQESHDRAVELGRRRSPTRSEVETWQQRWPWQRGAASQ